MQTNLDANTTFIMVKNSKEDQKLVLFGVLSDLNGGIYTNGKFKWFWSVTRVQHFFLREPEEVHDCISILHRGFLWETEVSRRADVCLFLNKATCQWTHSARCRKKNSEYMPVCSFSLQNHTKPVPFQRSSVKMRFLHHHSSAGLNFISFVLTCSNICLEIYRKFAAQYFSSSHCKAI